MSEEQNQRYIDLRENYFLSLRTKLFELGEEKYLDENTFSYEM
ncbi:hypothetical protein J2S74_003002 [Evansella vedderi]|uniref:Uncharacterized protein n=1 Tax=Evansella vedderi TaxID=38282 RepID=A0ABT9ZXE7_9BACI|nr:hypothetical protein [Evansella vedderi]MDQ0255620.1 hypothetical protein [Evansella vedderi]